MVRQTLDGDEQGFHRLTVKYQTAVHALILSMVKNHDDAQELTQEVFLKAYQKLGSLRQPDQFHSWLRQIARRQCRNWQRKNRHSPIALQDDIATQAPAADELMLLRETLTKVMQAIDELPEMERELLKEHYLDDVPYAELQTKHKLSYKVVTMRVLRAKQKVRERAKRLLLSIIAFPKRNNIRGSLLKRGLTTAKIGIRVRTLIVWGGFILVAGSAVVLLWQSHQPGVKAPNPVVNGMAEEASPKLRETIDDNSSRAHTGRLTERQETEELEEEDHEQILEAIAWLDSLEPGGQEQTEKNTGVEDEQILELTPELQEKIELYAELAAILPELMQKSWWGVVAKTASERASIKRHGELFNMVFTRFESVLRYPAIVETEYGSGINMDQTFAQVAEHLGKELPFDGNPDYFAAEDYKGGAGGFWEAYRQ